MFANKTLRCLYAVVAIVITTIMQHLRSTMGFKDTEALAVVVILLLLDCRINDDVPEPNCCVMICADNAIPIQSWFSDPTDLSLLNLLPMLDALRFCSDVRSVLSRNLHLHRF